VLLDTRLNHRVVDLRVSITFSGASPTNEPSFSKDTN
jgi:hypothetical protein